MKLFFCVFVLIGQVCQARNDDRFNFKGTSSRDFGPEDWNSVTCDNPGTCLGYPDGWETAIGWSLGRNRCRWCPESSNQRTCGQHRQSPIDLQRDRGLYNHTNTKECPDWHWMKYQNGACKWKDIVDNPTAIYRNNFMIRRHALQIASPIDRNGVLQCTHPIRGRRYPRIDYSKGFPDWWHLMHTEIITPSAHLQEGKRYDAEVHLSHFYSVDHYKNQLGIVALFLERDETRAPWPFLDKLICQWREIEEEVRKGCGIDSAPVYPGCTNYSRGHTPQPTTPPTRPPTPQPTPLTPQPTVPPTNPPTKSPTHSPTKVPTKNPTAVPTRPPTETPTDSPVDSSVVRLTGDETESPTTPAPTSPPTLQPNPPTKSPTRGPTEVPATNLTDTPTRPPTETPTDSPVESSVARLTGDETESPTNPVPTSQPTPQPTVAPTKNPTSNPTHPPTEQPTTSPTKNPTSNPTRSPTEQPTNNPTKNPTPSPTKRPTRAPTPLPTPQPVPPTLKPTPFPPPHSCVRHPHINYHRICKDGGCCESIRSASDFCHASYSFFGEDIHSVCYHCCDEPKIAAPAPAPHPNFPKIECTLVTNPYRICNKDSTGSCCSPVRSQTRFCAFIYSLYPGKQINSLCHHCCPTPQEVGPPLIRRLQQSDTSYFISNITESEEERRERLLMILSEPSPDEHNPSLSEMADAGEAEVDNSEITFLNNDPERKESIDDLEDSDDDQAYFDSLMGKRRLQEVLTDKEREERGILNYDDVPYTPYEWMLEVKTEYYFRYEGTQIVPPCKDKVHWRVMKDPILVHPRQIAEIQRLLAQRIAPRRSRFKACRRDTAGQDIIERNSVNGTIISTRSSTPSSIFTATAVDLARPVQGFHRLHRKVFCECKDWKSKFTEDRQWCRRKIRNRFYRHPYNFQSNGLF